MFLVKESMTVDVLICEEEAGVRWVGPACSNCPGVSLGDVGGACLL